MIEQTQPTKPRPPENDNPDWQALTSQLAINIYVLRTQGIIAAMNKKKQQITEVRRLNRGTQRARLIGWKCQVTKYGSRITNKAKANN